MRDTPRPRNNVYALAETPPSTVSMVPVVLTDVAKYSAASATSSGVPSRDSGRSLRILALVRSMNFSMASGDRPLTVRWRIVRLSATGVARRHESRNREVPRSRSTLPRTLGSHGIMGLVAYPEYARAQVQRRVLIALDRSLDRNVPDADPKSTAGEAMWW